MQVEEADAHKQSLVAPDAVVTYNPKVEILNVEPSSATSEVSVKQVVK